jgi:hypothetical protein
MASKKNPLLEKVLAKLSAVKRNPSWWEKVEPEHAELLAGLHEAWLAGTFGPHLKPAAAAISKTLSEENVATIGPDRVAVWLKKA